eukprot:35921_1
MKDVWNQRKIFFPLIIHFYDTATDIGVIYNWFELMKDEETINYDSVDMKTFFWCGITFLIIYRIGILLYAVYELCDGDGEWYHIILVLLDLYIFVVVYESFNEAQGIITKNAQRRKANKIRKKQKRQKEIEMNQPVKEIEMGQITNDKTVDTKPVIYMSEEVEIEPVDTQMYMQLFEAVTESMPQIVIQSVFIIRSANDEILAESGSNIGLLSLSILASLLSISNKYAWLDKSEDCIHYWYVIRVLWRLFHILSKFAVFTLIWTVLGGVWLPIWVGICYIYWVIINRMHDDKIINFFSRDDIAEHFKNGLLCLIAIPDCSKKNRLHFLLKWIETTVGLTMIIIFILIINNETNNERVLIYFVLGVFAHLMDLVLYISMYFENILI